MAKTSKTKKKTKPPKTTRGYVLSEWRQLQMKATPAFQKVTKLYGQAAQNMTSGKYKLAEIALTKLITASNGAANALIPLAEKYPTRPKGRE